MDVTSAICFFWRPTKASPAQASLTTSNLSLPSLSSFPDLTLCAVCAAEADAKVAGKKKNVYTKKYNSGRSCHSQGRTVWTQRRIMHFCRPSLDLLATCTHVGRMWPAGRRERNENRMLSPQCSRHAEVLSMITWNQASQRLGIYCHSYRRTGSKNPSMLSGRL